MPATFYAFCLFLPFLALGQSLTRKQQQEEQNRDLREICRANLAGHYFALRNSSERNGAFVTNLKAKIARIQGGIAKTEAALAQELQRRKEAYSFEVETRISQIQGQLTSLKGLAQTEQTLLAKCQTDLDQSLAEQVAFVARLTKVFKIEKDQEGVGYKERIVYLQDCHKFEFLCPLPKEQRGPLGEIMGEKNPESCRRYGQMEAPTRPKDPH